MHEDVRYPAVAGRFYPIEKDALISSIERCISHELGPGPISDGGVHEDVRAVLVPHAGYMASGMNAAHGFHALKNGDRPDAYVVIGPDHYGVPYRTVMCSDAYLTPLGECPVHREICGRLRELIPDDPRAHMREHSVEVEIPFLQYIDPDAKIVPVIMGRQDIGTATALADALKEACRGFDVRFVASSDLMHYVPYDTEKGLDSMLLEHVTACDIGGMYRMISEFDMSVCGYGPIAAAIMASGSTKGELLKHTNSWDSLSYDRNAVVGYASAKFA
ncbi:MAG: AmmeMemoRadiSam system protein B [Candidatus Methanomethylophilaceae archaeon]